MNETMKKSIRKVLLLFLGALIVLSIGMMMTFAKQGGIQVWIASLKIAWLFLVPAVVVSLLLTAEPGIEEFIVSIGITIALSGVLQYLLGLLKISVKYAFWIPLLITALCVVVYFWKRPKIQKTEAGA